jgi:hypothetical protein
MWTPLQLAYSIFMTGQTALTFSADWLCRPTGLQHAAVPYLHGIIDPGARKDERSVFIPI